MGAFIIVVKGLNPGVESTFTGEEQYIRVGGRKVFAIGDAK